MPSTTRSRGGAAGATAAAGSDGNFLAVEPVDELSADHQLTTEQGNMNVPPKDLMDSEIVRLWASLTASRKSLDDLKV